ncbi:MAG: D-2-hydroxyacid dehydrogenase [Clostridiales Family XIII bacterium]|jgi:D-3-phosphoglycerate dehydrogenase|nr:D-2-hydroxyacid dehydrogenase [Clostridiales Family XIII bacterium]
MAKILVTDGIDRGAAEALRAAGHEVTEQFFPPDELCVQAGNFDAIVVRSATKVTREVLDGAMKAGKLSLVIRGGVGVDNIDVPHAEELGITVRNTPAASSNAVAELAIGHMFALARYIYISNVTMRAGAWEKKSYTGRELQGKTLGLIGFGRIARETARIARGIGMKVIYHSRRGRKEGFDEFEYRPFEEVLSGSDFISLHVPVDKERGALIGDAEFALMKDGVYLINCARGGVVDEEALLAALDSGKVAAAALDVFETEPPKDERILQHERISLTPHIGASTKEAQQKIGAEVVKIIEEELGGR